MNTSKEFFKQMVGLAGLKLFAWRMILFAGLMMFEVLMDFSESKVLSGLKGFVTAAMDPPHCQGSIAPRPFPFPPLLPCFLPPLSLLH